MLFDVEDFDNSDLEVVKLNCHNIKELRKSGITSGFDLDSLEKFSEKLRLLPDNILGHKPRKGWVSRVVFSRWQEMMTPTRHRSELKNFFTAKQDWVIQQIKEAQFFHGCDWFVFDWLLGYPMTNFREDMSKPSNLAKLTQNSIKSAPSQNILNQRANSSTYKKTQIDIFGD